ncbi:MAG: glycosyltransferase family 9 protein [Planctomycetes bacterium]|nr:glycosyltransferase family 9 protein [Planctomycetota bacterium]
MPDRILIVKLSSLGDVLHALPAGQALRQRFPHAHIGWAVERSHAGLLRGQSWLDETIVWDRGQRGGLLDFVRRLRCGSWDLAIDLQGLFRSGLITWLSGAPRRLGAAQAREGAPWFYTETVSHRTLDCHAVERALELIAPLGATCELAPLVRPYLDFAQPTLHTPGPRLFPLWPAAEDVVAVERWLAASGVDLAREQLVAINPHCRRAANLWPAAKFVALVQQLAKLPNVRVALVGGAPSRALCDQIERDASVPVLRADGQFSLLGSAELFARASVVVTGDTGPMHIAAAVGVPIVALLGATAPARTGPYASNATVIRKRLDCAPCLAKQCRLGQNPPPCMDLIEVREVVDAVVERMQAAPVADEVSQADDLPAGVACWRGASALNARTPFRKSA